MLSRAVEKKRWWRRTARSDEIEVHYLKAAGGGGRQTKDHLSAPQRNTGEGGQLEVPAIDCRPPHATQVPAGAQIQRMAPNLRRGIMENEKTAFESHPSSPRWRRSGPSHA